MHEKGQLIRHAVIVVCQIMSSMGVRPLPSRVLEAIRKLSFFHLARSTCFHAALAYVDFLLQCKIDWLALGDQFVLTSIFPYHWGRTTVSDRLAVEGGVKRREDGTKFRVARQKGLRVTWHALDFKRRTTRLC